MHGVHAVPSYVATQHERPPKPLWPSWRSHPQRYFYSAATAAPHSGAGEPAARRQMGSSLSARWKARRHRAISRHLCGGDEHLWPRRSRSAPGTRRPHRPIAPNATTSRPAWSTSSRRTRSIPYGLRKHAIGLPPSARRGERRARRCARIVAPKTGALRSPVPISCIEAERAAARPHAHQLASSSLLASSFCSIAPLMTSNTRRALDMRMASPCSRR